MNVKHQDSQKELFFKELNNQYSTYAIKNHVNQSAFAAELGTSQSIVSNYLTGDRFPTLNHLCAICIILRCDPHTQHQLFHLGDYDMPDKYGDGDKRSRIVRNYMDYCSEHPELTLTKCEDELIEKGCVPLVTKR